MERTQSIKILYYKETLINCGPTAAGSSMLEFNEELRKGGKHVISPQMELPKVLTNLDIPGIHIINTPRVEE